MRVPLTVMCLAVLPNGRLASGSTDTTIRVWDLETEVGRLRGHTRPVSYLAVLPNGRLASGSHDNTVRVWDLATHAEIVCLRGHTLPVTYLAVLPNSRLASVSQDRTVRVWTLQSVRQLAVAKIAAVRALGEPVPPYLRARAEQQLPMPTVDPIVPVDESEEAEKRAAVLDYVTDRMPKDLLGELLPDL